METAKNICTVCNYVFDETLGEPRQNILPSVRFAELTEQWLCPDCGSSKEMFQPCSCVSLSVYEKTCLAHKDDVQEQLSTACGPFSKSMQVGQMVAQYPLCACVLEQYGIDYCCGGKITLEQACRKKGLNIMEVLTELAKAAQKDQPTVEPDWTRTSLKELIGHIVDTYHEPLRSELRRVLPLAEKVARVHGENHPEMIEVLNIFARFKDQLEVHMQKEEIILFPSIASMESNKSEQPFGCGGGIEHPIAVMMQEHEDAGEAMSAMSRLTNSYAPPPDACNTFKVLLHSLARIESEMHQHVHKENNILFPRTLALFGTTPDNAERCAQPAK